VWEREARKVACENATAMVVYSQFMKEKAFNHITEFVLVPKFYLVTPICQALLGVIREAGA